MKKIIAGGVVALAIMGAAGGAVATKSDDRTAQEGGPIASAQLTSKTANVKRCDSGPADRIYNRIVNQPSLSFEGADTVVPGTQLVVVGPAGGGTVNVTFSAEDQLRGSTPGENFDWAELEVLLNGVPLQPAGGAADPMALTGSPTYAMNSAQFCGRIHHGRNTIKAVTRITDNEHDDSLSLWLDDYTLHVERS